MLKFAVAKDINERIYELQKNTEEELSRKIDSKVFKTITDDLRIESDKLFRKMTKEQDSLRNLVDGSKGKVDWMDKKLIEMDKLLDGKMSTEQGMKVYGALQ
jgi:hypothetical protein